MNEEVLLLDDDTAVLEILAGVLSNAGYACHRCSDPLEALSRVASTETISLVVSDIYMPGMTGLEFVHRLMALNRASPRVLLLTGQPSMETAVDALRLGVCDFLTKPVRPAELLEAVRRALAARRLTESPELAKLIQQSRELTARLQKLSASSAPPRAAAPAPDADEGVPPLLRSIETFQRIRAHYIVANKLDDVAWDLLLEIASAEQQRQRLSVSGLMVSRSYVSSTTLLRRVNELVDRGFVTRIADPHDARRHYVALTAEAHELIAQFLRQVDQQVERRSAASLRNGARSRRQPGLPSE